MRPLIIAQLTDIANDLDSFGLIEYATRIDHLMDKIALFEQKTYFQKSYAEPFLKQLKQLNSDYGLKSKTLLELIKALDSIIFKAKAIPGVYLADQARTKGIEASLAAIEKWREYIEIWESITTEFEALAKEIEELIKMFENKYRGVSIKDIGEKEKKWYRGLVENLKEMKYNGTLFGKELDRQREQADRREEYLIDREIEKGEPLIPGEG